MYAFSAEAASCGADRRARGVGRVCFVKSYQAGNRLTKALFSPKRRPFLGSLLIGVAWVMVCAIGAYLAMRHEFEPGQLDSLRRGWPADTALEAKPGRITVVAFLHPRCVCTAATVKQLLHALRAQPQVTIYAVVLTPGEAESTKAWDDGEYARMIRASLSGARIITDREGAECGKFGALTSGTIIVFDREGQEIFRGGITNRRGGEDSNPGLRQFCAALTGSPAEKSEIPPPVFGCALVPEFASNTP